MSEPVDDGELRIIYRALRRDLIAEHVAHLGPLTARFLAAFLLLLVNTLLTLVVLSIWSGKAVLPGPWTVVLVGTTVGPLLGIPIWNYRRLSEDQKQISIALSESGLSLQRGSVAAPQTIDWRRVTGIMQYHFGIAFGLEDQSTMFVPKRALSADQRSEMQRRIAAHSRIAVKKRAGVGFVYGVIAALIVMDYCMYDLIMSTKPRPSGEATNAEAARH